MYNDSVRKRFWAKVRKGGDDECWEWVGARTNGYGTLYAFPQRRPEYAHRIAWELEHGEPVPPGLFVCHSCDCPSCVNPAHLWVGTAKDNTTDMMNKGRGARGHYRLSPTEISQIKQAYMTRGATLRALGAEYGYSHEFIRQLVAWTPENGARPCARLTDSQAQDIVRKYTDEWNKGRFSNAKELSERFCVSVDTIHRVVNGHYDECD